MSNPKRDYMSFFGQYIEFVDSHWKDAAKMLNFVPDDIGVIQKFPVVVKQYFLDALFRFLTLNFVASILASSESVEAAVNRDSRMRFDPINQWHTLTAKTLKLAEAEGLPVGRLLIGTDDLSKGKVDFLTFRHKFGHGDVHITSPTKGRTLILETTEKKGALHVNLRDTPGRLLVALQQLKLAYAFLSDLYKDAEPEQMVVVDMRKKEPNSPRNRKLAERKGAQGNL